MSSQFFFLLFFFSFHFLLLVRLKWQHWEHFLVGFPGADTHQPRKLFCWEGSACKTKQDAHAYALGPASAHIRWQSTHSPGVGMSRLTAAVTCSASVPSVSSLHKHTSIGEHTHTHTHRRTCTQTSHMAVFLQGYSLGQSLSFMARWGQNTDLICVSGPIIRGNSSRIDRLVKCNVTVSPQECAVS